MLGRAAPFMLVSECDKAPYGVVSLLKCGTMARNRCCFASFVLVASEYFVSDNTGGVAVSFMPSVVAGVASVWAAAGCMLGLCGTSS